MIDEKKLDELNGRYRQIERDEWLALVFTFRALYAENADLKSRLAGTWNQEDLQRIIKDLNAERDRLLAVARAAEELVEEFRQEVYGEHAADPWIESHPSYFKAKETLAALHGETK